MHGPFAGRDSHRAGHYPPVTKPEGSRYTMTGRLIGSAVGAAAVLLLALAALVTLAGPAPARAASPAGGTPVPVEGGSALRPAAGWVDIAPFPTVVVSPTPGTSPLRLKRAAAAAYFPNGLIYVLGGRHGVDGEDVAMRWIWAYDPAANTWTRKNALLDADPPAQRFTANMAAAVLTDANGVRIYAVGGSSVDSQPTPVVRVYDPNADQLSVLSSDPWPASPERIPGGSVVYNNKLYIFGGFSSIGAGGVFSDTWVFDPLGTDGNRWRPLAGADLNLGRGYIAGTVVDGVIYAVGGDVWNASARQLVPVSNVEKLDLHQANPTWQPVASLPTARGDMGAWGYDSNAPYEIAGKVVVAGGHYDVPDAQGYEYDTHTDAWTTFPDLAHATRNYAYAQLGGYLYAFGGYDYTNGTPSGANWNQMYDATTPPGTPTPTVTGTPPTSTPTRSPTQTHTPSPTPCNGGAYSYATGTATIVAGVDDTGNHCDDCTTQITLPFAFRLYELSFTSAYVSSNGQLDFQQDDSSYLNTCLPDTAASYAIFPHWQDMRTDGGTGCSAYTSGCGVFTSTSGSAPNRVFNIEWRAVYYSSGLQVNFEVRLYEGNAQGRFDLIYGSIPEGGSGATVGVQKDTGSAYTEFECDAGGLSTGLLVTFEQPTCASPTPVPTLVPTQTATPVPTNTALPTGTRLPDTVTVTPMPTSTAPPTDTITPVPSATATPCPIRFTDVDPGSPFYDAIRCLACRGIVAGYGDGTFRPYALVTRGQAAKFAANAAGWTDPVPPSQQTFQDVLPGSPFWLYVERLAAHGAISGYACGGPGEPCVPPGNRPYYRPTTNVTRAQLAKIISNAAGLIWEPPAGFQTFADVPPADPFWRYIERVAHTQLVTGYTCGGPGEPCDPQRRPYYRPGNNATRGQTAKIVAAGFFPGCGTP